ncbi:MAG: diaminopimelate epimerase, partial [Bacteroidales bacterium]
MLEFLKYHGSGNDFILIDNRNGRIDPSDQSLIRSLCDRKFGIGADGLILLTDHPELDFEMQYFNRDGPEGSMCGNGARCIAVFAQRLGLVEKRARFQAFDGAHDAIIEKKGVRISMMDITGIDKRVDHFFLNTGSPHVVLFREDVKTMNVFEEGRKIRYNKLYGKEGTNVDFIWRSGDGIYVRTYERGVEDETLSCGTGVVAS